MADKHICRDCECPFESWKDMFGDMVEDLCMPCDMKRQDGMLNDREMGASS